VTIVTEPPAGFDSAAEAYRLRKSRRTGRPIAAVNDVWLTGLRVQRLTEHALVDVATLAVDVEQRRLLARAIVAALPDDLAGDFARTLVDLGDGYRAVAAKDDADSRAAYAALYAHAEHGAKRELLAREHLHSARGAL
jgi:hypothetical protein